MRTNSALTACCLLPLLSGCLAASTVTASPVMIDGTAPAPTAPATTAATTPEEQASTPPATGPSSGASSGTAGATPTPGPTATTVRRFDPPVGVAKASDFPALEATGVSHDFVNFAKVTLASGPDPNCPGTLTVSGFLESGFAAGTQGAACKPDTEKALWARTGGVWAAVWHGTGLPDCAALRTAKFPAALAGEQCLDNGAPVPYRDA